MLSIGKLATGQAEYYLEQAHGSVTRAAAVSSGVEDYYLGGPEADGVWAGAGAAALGLRGTVGARELRSRARRRASRDRRAARPRPHGAGPGLRSDVLGAEERQRAVRDRRRRAARRRSATRTTRPSLDALGYMERAGGGDAARAGRRACDRRQRVRRGGVPASHLARRRPAAAHPRARRQPDARRRRAMVDARRPPHLRARQDRRLPLRGAAARHCSRASSASSGRPVRNGIAEIDGVAPTVLRAFSRRRADIEAELERRGAEQRRGCQVAALADPACQGLSRHAGAARAGMARARRAARARPARSSARSAAACGSRR